MQALLLRVREKRLAAGGFTRRVAAMFVCLVGGHALWGQDSSQFGTGASLPEIPVARSPLTLLAVNDPVTGKSAFSYDGTELAPVIHASPGSRINLEYQNRMSSHSKEVCVDGPCMNMTNL